MKTIRQVGIKLKPTKYKLHKREKKYLKVIFNLTRVPADPVITKAILQLENPKNSETYSMFHWVLQLL